MAEWTAEDLHFGGHETFALRQLWLRKAVCLALYFEDTEYQDPPSEEEAMVWFGVGKNMLASMKFWAKAAGFIRKDTFLSTRVAHEILMELDRNFEHPTTTWFTHWQLAKKPDGLTALWYVFNMVNTPTISRDELQSALMRFAAQHGKKVSAQTVKRDADVVVRSYLAPESRDNKPMTDEAIEPYLSDLDLMQPVSRGVVALPRSSRPTLDNALFAYALTDYWLSHPNPTSTLDYSSLMHGVGSPGRVFRLDETSLLQRLEALEELTEGELVWTEQAGIRTVTRRRKLLSDTFNEIQMPLLRKAYKAR